MGYVVFEDAGLNHRVYHSFHNTFGQAFHAQRKFKGTVNIGVMYKDEFERLVEE